MSQQNRNPMRKFWAFLGCTLLFTVFGCLMSGFWVSGGNTFWRPIDYFPLPVESVLIMEPFGHEFWVKSDDNKSYHIAYPCENGQLCWNEIDGLPEVDISYVSYKVTENTCENDTIVYPLLHKIKSCITSIVPNESPWMVSLALTDDHRLWIWQKPWNSPYNDLAFIVSSVFRGALIGLLVGIYLAWRIK
jgi:FtsH-binding integral membrane protein